MHSLKPIVHSLKYIFYHSNTDKIKVKFINISRMENQNQDNHKQSLHSFAIQVVVYELVLMTLFGVFAKVDLDAGHLHN